MPDTAVAVGWKSRWTFIMAATGSAVGLGNIWKFPYITGEYGGGAFILVYLACILLVGVPVMMAETLIGRRARTDPIDAMSRLAADAGISRGWTLVGALGVLSGLTILMFYNVVGGWALDYMAGSATSSFVATDASTAEAAFANLTADTRLQLMWHSLFTLLAGAVVAGGVVRGIGATVDVLLPLLFVLLLMLLGYSWAEGDFAAGLAFLFNVDFGKITGEAVLVALGHAFFTLSLAMGAIMAYGAYMPQRAAISSTVLTVAALDTVVALLAGLVIFPLVFANGLPAGAGPGLMFVTLPLAFGNMPAGALFGTLFFALVTIAALSSAISLLEPAVAWLEKKGVKRLWGTIALSLVCWLGGVGSIHSAELFDFFDKVTARFTLPMGGLLIAIFVGWKIRRNPVRKDLSEMGEGLFNTWYVVLRFISPAGIILVFLHSLGLI